VMALHLLKKVFECDVDAESDCFARAEVDDVIRFASPVSFSGTTLTGEFYGKGSVNRLLHTHFPLNTSEQQLVYSSLALAQYAITANRRDPEVLAVLCATARNMLALYESGVGPPCQHR
ncbi:MAG: hypothetical protein ACE5HQ_14065, partial [Gemmatimonadota bacterium]